MKNYKEMAETVLLRVKEEQVAEKKKKQIIKRAVSSIMGFGVVALLGIWIWQSGIQKPVVPTEGSSETESMSKADTELTITEKIAVAIWANGKTQLPPGSVDNSNNGSFQTHYNGIPCTTALYQLLEKTKEDVIFPIFIRDRRYREVYADTTGFTYKGETYREFMQRAAQMKDLTEKEKLALFEREQEFYTAYELYCAQRIEQALSEQGITVIQSDGICYMFVTREELDALQLPDEKKYYLLAWAGCDDENIADIFEGNN